MSDILSHERPENPTLDDIFNMQPDLLSPEDREIYLSEDLPRLVAEYRLLRVKYNTEKKKPKKDQKTKAYANKIGQKKLPSLSSLLSK